MHCKPSNEHQITLRTKVSPMTLWCWWRFSFIQVTLSWGWVMSLLEFPKSLIIWCVLMSAFGSDQMWVLVSRRWDYIRTGAVQISRTLQMQPTSVHCVWMFSTVALCLAPWFSFMYWREKFIKVWRQIHLLAQLLRSALKVKILENATSKSHGIFIVIP